MRGNGKIRGIPGTSEFVKGNQSPAAGYEVQMPGKGHGTDIVEKNI